MIKIVIFSPDPQAAAELSTTLDTEFEITNIRNIESLDPLIHSWQPHIVIYMAHEFSSDHFRTLRNLQQQETFGLIAIQFSYNLKSELLAYESNFDHYLIRQTPIDSLKSRIWNLTNKIESTRITPTISHPLNLPQKSKPFQIDNLTIYLDQRLVLRGTLPVRITPTQHLILLAFITHCNQPLTREWLMQTIFRRKKITARTVDAHIAKLKATLPELKNHIISQYGDGYIFNIKVNNKTNAA
jgi:DNA-binding response OmpR family regulator